MSSQSQVGPAEHVQTYVDRLRARATALLAVRALAVAVGLTLVGVVLVAALTGPVVGPLLARLASAGLALLALGVSAALLWPARAWRGAGSCALLVERSPVLASRVRSVLELSAEARGASPQLVAAHAGAVSEELQAHRPPEVVPLRRLQDPGVLLGLFATVLSALILAGSDSVRAGALGLLRPAELRPDGTRIGSVVRTLRVRLEYPGYLRQPPGSLENPKRIEAPRGTTVELTINPRIESRAGSLLLSGEPLALRPAPGGRLFARFVVRESVPLALRLESGGRWYEDDARRSVVAVHDATPEAALHTHPGQPTTLELHESVPLRLRASDDHGLSTIELVVRTQAGTEERRRFWSQAEQEAAKRSLEDETAFVPAQFGAQAGDVVLVWLEARDGDVVSGPNVGVSKTFSFEIATDAQQLGLRLPLLREILDGALDALADRLEAPIGSHFDAALARQQELYEVNQAWLGKLVTLIGGARQSAQDEGLDFDQLEGILERTGRELTREAGAYKSRLAKAWAEADARVIEEQERDVLLLADMLAQGFVDEARQLTAELSALKDRMGELLAELRSTRSPEAQRELLAEIAKAQRRMRELAQSLARLSNRVPSEFINREALPQQDASSALADLRAAIEAGDMEAAERMLDALGQELATLTEQIESGGARFREAHFGSQDRARAGAQRELQMLAEEQERLADRTHGLVKRAAQRVKSRTGEGAAGKLEEQARSLERELQTLRETDPGSPEAPWLERSSARLRDAADALKTSDLAEAQRMAGAARSNLEQAASSLEQDARMFPGHQGETAERARTAAAAATSLRALEREIDRSLPRLGDAIDEAERQHLRGDVASQRGVRDKAEALGNKLEQGHDGQPLSPAGGRDLKEVADAMRRAERALETGDPQAAGLAQQEASEGLRELHERLQQRGGRGGGGARERRGQTSGGSADGDGRAHAEGPVRIPSASEHSSPVQRRRRLLDAMREPAPPAFEGAVGQYYKELLR